VSSNFIRWGGLGGLVAGVMYVAITTTNLIAPQRAEFISFSDYLIQIMLIIALVGILLAIAGLHDVQKDSYGILGMAASLTAFIGFTLLLVVSLGALLVGGEVLSIVFPLGLLVITVGLALLGIATIRAGVLQNWARWSRGVLLIIAFPLSVVLTVVFSAGGFLLGATWALVGVALLTSGQTSVQQPARVN
jgi:hypothetical protein